MDRAFGGASVLDRPVKEIMSPTMPIVGIGEPVSTLVSQLDRAPSSARARRQPSVGVRPDPTCLLRRARRMSRPKRRFWRRSTDSAAGAATPSAGDGFGTRAVRGQEPDEATKRSCRRSR
jgi:hypothetical protein